MSPASQTRKDTKTPESNMSVYGLFYGGDHRLQGGPPPAGSVIDDERRQFDHAACCI